MFEAVFLLVGIAIGSIAIDENNKAKELESIEKRYSKKPRVEKHFEAYYTIEIDKEDKQ